MDNYTRLQTAMDAVKKLNLVELTVEEMLQIQHVYNEMWGDRILWDDEKGQLADSLEVILADCKTK